MTVAIWDPRALRKLPNRHLFPLSLEPRVLSGQDSYGRANMAPWGVETPPLAARVQPSPALLDHAVGEASVYVQGASLKTGAALLAEAFQLPGYTSEGRIMGQQEPGDSEKVRAATPVWRRVLRGVSYAFSGVMLFTGLAALAGVGNTPMVAGTMFLLMGLITFPPVVGILRTRLKPLRPLWVPPLLAFALLLLMSPMLPPPPPKDQAPPPAARPKIMAADKPVRTQAAKPPLKPRAAPDDDGALYPHFAKQLLAPRLRDPDSAKITALIAFRTGKRLILCGKVNAKNGYGGYGGPQAFVISDDGVLLGEGELTAERVLAECNGETTLVVPERYLR